MAGGDDWDEGLCECKGECGCTHWLGRRPQHWWSSADNWEDNRSRGNWEDDRWHCDECAAECWIQLWARRRWEDDRWLGSRQQDWHAYSSWENDCSRSLADDRRRCFADKWQSGAVATEIQTERRTEIPDNTRQTYILTHRCTLVGGVPHASLGKHMEQQEVSSSSTCVRTDAHGTEVCEEVFHVRPYGRTWNSYC